MSVRDERISRARARARESRDDDGVRIARPLSPGIIDEKIHVPRDEPASERNDLDGRGDRAKLRQGVQIEFPPGAKVASARSTLLAFGKLSQLPPSSEAQIVAGFVYHRARSAAHKLISTT